MPRLQTKPSAKEPSKAQIAAREAGAARLRVAREARNNPARSTRNDLDTTDRKIGQPGVREMPSTGDARIEPSEIEVVDRPVRASKLELLKFMEEELTIVVHDSTNPTDEPIPYVINGGQRQAFLRGQKQRVKRKYVEVLARMKVTGYTQERFRDSQNIDSIRNIQHNALRYPFSIIEDTQKGRAWLDGILAEA